MKRMTTSTTTPTNHVPFYRTPWILNMALDRAEYPKNVAQYVCMHIFVYDIPYLGNNIDKYPKFAISDLIEKLKKLPKKERELMVKFFGINGGTQHFLRKLSPNDVALSTMLNQVKSISEKIRSFDDMCMYNPRFNNTIIEIGKKVDGQMSLHEKAKLAHMYFWVIFNFDFLPFSISPKENDGTIYVSLYSYEEEWKEFFSKIPDGDLSSSMILEFIKQSDLESDNLMTDFVNQKPVSIASIREAKKRLFPEGPWNSTYMQKSLIPVNFQELLEEYGKYRENWDFNEKGGFRDEFEMLYFGLRFG